MNMQFNSILSIILVPQIVRLIEEKEGLDDIGAINEFYKSKTYSLLEKEDTGLWHYSSLTLYHIWKEEKVTGTIIFPEESA